jgi:hypothetical protein
MSAHVPSPQSPTLADTGAQLKDLALDLSQSYPRSPRSTLGEYVLAARILDKCRALVNNTIGAYKYGSSIDRLFFDFSGIAPETFKSAVAQGLNDEQFEAWLKQNATQKHTSEIVQWNNEMRCMRVSDCSPELQGRLTNYIKNNLPEGTVIYSVLDIFDIEEGRLKANSFLSPRNTPQNQALNLSKDYPRSPRALLGGFVLAGRMLDKCRAVVAETQGDYDFDCGLDRHFLGFSEIKAEEFKSFVATGATDDAIGQWIQEHAKPKDPEQIMLWNNEWLDKRMEEQAPETQAYMETYIANNLPENAIVRVLFDVFDIEEKRIQF